MTIVLQSGFKGLSYTNLGKGSGRKVEGVTYTTAGGLLNRGTANGSHAGGIYTGSVKLYSF